MAEYTNSAVQEVAAGQNVVFSETAVRGTPCIQHREGSGLITLRGLTNQCKAKFLVTFGANIALPADGAAGAISLALAINGESVTTSQMIVTPTAVSAYFNVSASLNVFVPKDCCLSISVQNTSGVAIDVQNANIIIVREA